MLIEVASTERAMITGQTGSGKTFLARQLLHGVKRLVALDPKGMLRSGADDDGNIESWHLSEWTESSADKLRDGRPVRVRVPAPIDGNWEPYIWAVYRAGNCVLYIDEVYGVVPIGRRSPESLNAIYTRGRELGIGCIGVSQRPVWVPMEILSECEWFFCFRLLLDDDRRRMATMMGPDVMNKITDRYGFWTYNVHWDAPLYTPQLEVERVRAERTAEPASEQETKGDNRPSRPILFPMYRPPFTRVRKGA